MEFSSHVLFDGKLMETPLILRAMLEGYAGKFLIFTNSH